MNKKRIVDKFGIHPTNFALARALVGDNSDNIKGVNGVGYKTLTKCFQSVSEAAPYTIVDMIRDAKKISLTSKRKIYKNVLSEEKTIRRNWKLILLDVNNLAHNQIRKLHEEVENFSPAWNNIGAHKLLNELGIKGIDLLLCNQLFKQLKRG